MENVVNSLAPIIEKVCSIPKFANNTSDAPGVAMQVLERVGRVTGRFAASRSNQLRKTKRKIQFDKDKGDCISPQLHETLCELGRSWQQLMTNHDRDGATLVLQMTLKAIPKRSGMRAGV